MDNVRGVIRNREFATQIRDFHGLRIGNITPTDVDAMIEYHGQCYVFIELKYGDAELPYGQKIAFERLCDDLQKVKPTLFIVASHDGKGDIDVANSTVRKYRYEGKWITPQGGNTWDLVNRFVTAIEKKQ